jgi:hypothetical protein
MRIIMTELEKCPVCDNGYLRPIGKVATDDTSDVREYQCDNSDCETNKSNIKINEQNVNVGENLDVKVTKADDRLSSTNM